MTGETTGANPVQPADAGNDEREQLLAGYGGAAALTAPDGEILATNAKGAALGALIRHGAAPEIHELMSRATEHRTIASGSLSLKGSKGEIMLEVTVIPKGTATPPDSLLVLSRDMTMERNLRTTLVESRQRYKDLVEVSSDFSWEVSAAGMFVFVSPKGALGYTAEELVEKEAESFVVDPEDFSPVPFLSERELDDVELWLKKKDGTTACMLLSCLPLFADDGNGRETWRGCRGVCRDVTEERESEAALARARHREQLLNYIVSQIRDELEPENMLEAAGAATARALGAAGCRIYRLSDGGSFAVAADYGNGAGLEELEGRLDALKGGGQVSELEAGDWQVLATATHYRNQINGALAMWKGKTSGPWDDDHQLLIADVANQLGIANEQISNHERIVALSRTDGMTGLLNRRAFYEEELPRRVARLERNRQTAALFYVDMDNFKRVNDVHGHQAGDEAILFLRDMLMDFSRPGDVIARLGGDEFAMWLDGISEATSRSRAQQLLDRSREMRKMSGDDEHPLGISVGVAIFNPDVGESLDDLLARADAAMYAVKKASKGGFQMAPPPGGLSTAEER